MGTKGFDEICDETIKDTFRHLFYGDAQDDIRGQIVYDRDHRKIGAVSDVYCDAADMRPRYIEIEPFKNDENGPYLYPYEYASWVDDSPVFLDSTLSALRTYDDYHYDNVMQGEAADLVPYGEVLEVQASDDWTAWERRISA